VHIAYLINQFPPNVTAGLGRYAEALAPHLTREHRLTVFTVNDGHLPATERHGPLRVHRPMGRLLRAVFRRRRLNRTRRLDFALLAANVLVGNLRHVRAIRALHRSEGIDVLAVHDVTNVVAALLCHRLLRLPLVFHLHTTEYTLAARRRITPGRGLERRLGRTAARVVVPTPELRDQLVADGWAADRIEVIPQGNPLDRAGVPDPPGVRTELGLPPGRTVLLFVGRLEVQKGIFTLVEALPAIVAADPSVVLVVVGEGDRDRVAALAAAGGVSDHVVLVERWLGVDELPSWYAAADLCVFPSRFEPFGLVAAEAMSLGRPVVLGDGFSRIFAPAARYAPATDAAGLARVLVELLADPGQRAAMGERGRALVAERFDWSRTAAATLAVYAAARRDTAPAATRAAPRPTT
jgi:glycogen synthase